MPLPAVDAPWPPPALRPALDHIAEADTWWSGDVDQLEARYGAAGIGHPAQHAGGIVGAVARLWWGRPRPPADPSQKLHVPLPGDLTRAYSNLLFAEPVKLSADDDATSERLDELLDEGMHARLIELAETVAALGGAWVRPMHDGEVSDRPWFDVVAPDAGLPEWRGGRVHAVNLWSVVQRDTAFGGEVVWRHVERHEAGWVVHRLYQGTDNKIGRPVPLEDVEALAHLAGQVNAAGAIPTGYRRPSCVYVPRIRPARAWRHDPLLAPMGRSIFDGIIPIFDAIDETYTSLMREVRLAKGRVIVGDDVLTDLGRGRGATFDHDREVFTRTAAMGKDMPITAVQFDLRVAPLREALSELTEVALRRAGLNGSTLGEPGEAGPAMTAREVLTKERRSLLTRETGIRYTKPELTSALGALLALDARAFRTPVNPHAAINVEFPDTVTEDPTTLAGYVEALFRSQSASARRRVEILNPDRSEEWVDEEAAAVEAEFGIGALVEPDEFVGDGSVEDEPVEDDGGGLGEDEGVAA